MTLKQRLIHKNNYIWLILGIDIFMYLVILFLVFNISFGTILKFLLASTCSILLPGFAIYTFINIKLTRIGQLCMAYILGYAFIVIEYFLAEVFNRRISFTAISIFFTISSCGIIAWRIKKDRTILASKDNESETIQIQVLSLFLILNILGYAANNLGTDVIPVFKANRDIQYWVNNTIALKLSWPADNLFMSGNMLNYHYFSNIPIAFLCEVFHIDVFSMSFPLYTITKAIVMVGATGFFFDCIKTNKIITILGYVLILCTTGIEAVSLVTYVHHSLLLPFGCDVGYAYGMIFSVFLLKQWERNKFEIGLFIGTVLTWIMCVGAKAPIAAVLISLVAFICFYWLIANQGDLSFGYGVPILSIFLVISKYCVGMFSVVKGEAAWSIGLYNICDIMALGEPEDWAVVAKIIVTLGRLNTALAVIIRWMCVNPVVILIYIVSVVVNIIWIRQKKVSGKDIYFQVVLGLTALWGLSLGVAINAGGHSEMYFSMAALLPMFFMIFITLVNYDKWGISRKYLMVYRSIKIFFVVILILGVYRFSWSAWSGTGAVKNSLYGLKNIYHSMVSYDYSDQIDSGIRGTDVTALNWIRDNAEKDALIMTDKAVMTDNPAYYLYGIFCERQQYLEGSDMLAGEEVEKEIARRKEIIRSVYNNIDGAIQLAKGEGIDYIVQTVDITPGFIYDEEQLELVKNTETMNIYKVK